MGEWLLQHGVDLAILFMLAVILFVMADAADRLTGISRDIRKAIQDDTDQRRK